MSKPVYQYWCIQNFTEAWYQLSKEDQDNLFSKIGEIDKRVGAKNLIVCNSRWADEETVVWGVTEYPDMDACQEATEQVEKIEVFRYFSAKTILGTKM